MKKSTKIVQNVIWGLTLVIAVAAMSTIYWFKINKAKWNQMGEVAMAEGAAAGKNATCQQCIALAVQRLPTGSGSSFDILDQVKVQLYLKSCLQQAKGSLPYCADVPSETDVAKSADWRENTYKALSLAAGVNPGESPIVIAIQEHCLQIAVPPAPKN
ncbi:MAG TPA: hypothetical protein VK914_02760 [bacterium]|jgi:hypothetical protein|nr:hypothetical protein [bacterium]